MKFLLMIVDDERTLAGLPPGEIEKLVAGHTDLSRELRAAGALVEGHRLGSTQEAATIRRRGGDWIATDGSFAESREVLGGYYLIEVAARDEAIAWAKRVPLLDVGAVEVRPARTGACWRGEIRGARKYLVAFLANAERPLSRAEIFSAIDAHYELSLELAAQGRFVSSRALEPPRESATVRAKEGRSIVTDGPFVESKEFLAGYFVVACDSREEALEWAKRLTAGGEAAEVRPVWRS